MKMSFSAPRPWPHASFPNSSFRNSHLSRMAQRRKVSLVCWAAAGETVSGFPSSLPSRLHPKRPAFCSHAGPETLRVPAP